MLTSGYANLDKTRVVIIGRLLSKLKVNFRLVIDDKSHARAIKLAISLPILCLVTKLYKVDRVNLLRSDDKR